MEVNQIYNLVNQVTEEVLGKSDVLKEDLSGVVDLGTELFNANAVDRYVKSLVNRIGKVVFVNRAYKGVAPSVLMDSWEYGSVLEKISMDLPVAQENESWTLVDGVSYDVNIFASPSVSAKFFNSKVTFEIQVSITELQVKQSFTSGEQLNAFISMIYNAVDKSMSVKLSSLILRTINNMVGETLYDEYRGDEFGSKSGVKAVNLLKLYNDEKGTELTLSTAIKDLDFLKYASYMMSLYVGRLGNMSTLYNVGKKERFTPKDLLHIVLLSDFAKASSVYLQSDTYHKELVALPNYEEVSYWQGSGTSFALEDVSKIDITTSSGEDITISGVLGVMFDRDALGVTNQDRRVTTNYNAKGEFYNNYYKWDCGYFNDTNENMVVFFAQ